MKGYMAVIGLFALWGLIPVAIAQTTASPLLILAPTLAYGYWLLFHGGGIRKFDNWIAAGK
jgi:hypothetical protein